MAETLPARRARPRLRRLGEGPLGSRAEPMRRDRGFAGVPRTSDHRPAAPGSPQRHGRPWEFGALAAVIRVRLRRWFCRPAAGRGGDERRVLGVGTRNSALGTPGRSAENSDLSTAAGGHESSRSASIPQLLSGTEGGARHVS